MCGIAGSFRRQVDVGRALDRIAHRGPDGRGVKTLGDATHGHVRLALVDLSEASAQPFEYRGGLLSFVGEIWNFRELRAELEAFGHEFRTTGDTEVLAASLSQWGTGALDRLDGMFGFAWSSGDSHWLVRDRWGKVPLYAQRHGGGFAWASERKGIPGRAEPVPAAGIVDMVTGEVRRWWRPLSGDVPRIGSASDVLDLLRQGTRKRLQADAPVCCLISGGLDSSLVLRLAAEVTSPVAYTAVFDPRSRDLAMARALCSELGIELREVRIPPPTPKDITAAVRAIEVPSKAQVEIALLCIPLARQIAADGFKACLSGEAADEVFGGYGNMAIKASKADDAGWREIRLAQVEKMARGNFLRCNKAFMAEGVECRLPFMERGLVEGALALGKRQCPPGKGLLKAAGEMLLPRSIVRRQKETFQGGAGMSDAVARAISNPTRLYNAEFRRLFS